MSRLSQRAALGLMGRISVFFGLLSIALIIVFIPLLIQDGPKVGNVALFLLILFGSLGCAAYFFTRTGYQTIHKAENMEPVAPLTKRNMEQLPMRDSLVRGAEKPAEPQAAVLVRAAQAGEAETNQEQLLRPGRVSNDNE